MAHVFISYHKNSSRDYARKLADYLIANGFDVWIDDRIDYGTNWERVIFKAIDESAGVIVIMTPGAYESDWVQAERLYAKEAKKTLFPMLLDGKIFPAYLGWQIADVRDGELPPSDFLNDLATAGVPRSNTPGRNVAQVPPAVTPKAHDISLPTTQTPPRTSITQSRRFEAAMPSQIISNAPTEVWAKISLPDSPGLRGELPAVVPSGDVIGKEDARATGFPFKFPIDPRTGEAQPVTVSVRAKSTALTFDDGEITVELPPDYDSQTVIFSANLNADSAPGLRVRVTLDLVYEARLIAQISVSALVQAPGRLFAPPTWAMASAAIGAGTPGKSASEAAPVESYGTMPDYMKDVLSEDAMRGGEGGMSAPDDDVQLPQQPPPRAESPPTPPPKPVTGAADYEDFVPQPAARKSVRRSSSAPIAMIASLALVFVVVLFLVQSNAVNLANNDVLTVTGQALAAATGTAAAVDSPTDMPTATNTKTPSPQPTQAVTLSAGGLNTPRASGAESVRVGIPSNFDACPADTARQIESRLPDHVNVQFLDTLNLDDPAALGVDYDLILSGNCEGEIMWLRVTFLKRVAPPEVFDLTRLDVSEVSSNLDFFVLLGTAAVNYLYGDFATAATQFYDVARNLPHPEQGNALYFMKANGFLLAGQPADAISAYDTAGQDSSLYARAANNRAIAAQELLLANGGEDLEAAGEAIMVETVLVHLETAHQNTSDASQQAVILTNIGLANLYFGRSLDDAQSRCADALNFNSDYLMAHVCLIGVVAEQIGIENPQCPITGAMTGSLTQSLQASGRLGADQPYAQADMLYWQIKTLEGFEACAVSTFDLDSFRQQRADLLAQQLVILQTDQLE